MSELDSDIIGGRSLRSRRSLASKNTKVTVAFGTGFTPPRPRVTRSKQKNEEPVVSRMKTPAKTPARRSRIAKSESGEVAAKTPAKRTTKIKATEKSFADIKMQEELTLARKEVADLQTELAQIRKDKTDVEEQLNDALEAPITSPIPEEDPAAVALQEEQREEIERMKQQMEELREENERIVAEKEEKEKLFQEEKAKLENDMNKWKGHFEEIRETETEKMKNEEEDEAIRKAKEEAKEIEIERKNEEIERLRIEKEELAKAAAASKPTQEEDDILESLRKQIENVDIARKEAYKNAEENKQLVQDTRDAYEDKLAKLVIKVDQWKKEADKQHSTCTRLREERDKYRQRCDEFRAGSKKTSDKQRAHDNENGLEMLRHAYKEAKSCDSIKSNDSSRSAGSSRSKDRSPVRDPRIKTKESTPPLFSAPRHKVNDDRERELEDLVITSQFSTNKQTKRIVLKEGEDAPESATRVKDSCMPSRVAIEPAFPNK